MPKEPRVKTKDALADALLELMSSGVEINKIRIRQITEACAVDRQTFYYYFKNIQELGDYTFNREVSRIFGTKTKREFEDISWRERARGLVNLLREENNIRVALAPVIGEKPFRDALYRTLLTDLERNYLPQLIDAGLTIEDARRKSTYIACMLEAVASSWLNGTLAEDDIEGFMDSVGELMNDYLLGVRTRTQG